MVQIASLPIYAVIGDIRKTLASHNRLILQAPPGAGKTTALPLSLLQEPWLEGKMILLLSPRRVAARAAAERMAQMLGEEVGESVGYHIRSERRMGPKTRILVMTEGILTRRLQSDPALEDVALVIFDEFHERHLHSDLSLAFALQTQEFLRDDLKIAVMSATLDTLGLEAVLDFPPVITSEGKSYPVAITHLPANTPALDGRNLISHLFSLIREIVQRESGNILVFLPGVREIKSLETLLKEFLRNTAPDILVAPLYGDLSKNGQEAAIYPCEQRKIVLSTNIAETSLTIEGIRIVIDSGLERVVRFDPSSGMERLITQKISRASATQRAGRAGRQSEGSCYRLWSEIAHHSLSPYSEPEILQSDLAPLALELSAWGSRPEDLAWIDPPPPRAFKHASTLLEELGLLTSPAQITPQGRSVLSLGLHPRLAHMLHMGQKLQIVGEAILLAALLSERDPLSGSSERSADIRERFWLLSDLLQNRPIPPHLREGVQRVLLSARDLAKRLKSPLKLTADFSDTMLAVLLAMAYPDRISRSRDTSNRRYLSVNGKESVLDPRDDLSGSEWLIIARSDGHTQSARIHLCAPISLEDLETYLPHLFETRQSMTWNPKTQRVEAREILRMGEILLRSHTVECNEREKIGKILCEGIVLSGLEALPWTEQSRSLLYRLRAFHRHGEITEDFSDAALFDTLPLWLMPHFTTHSSLKDLHSLDLTTILASRIEWETLRRLDALLPPFFTAPTGSKIPIDYSDPDAPVLALRIQEMFGVTTHPSVMGGKLPLLIHLLSPAHRPIQMTRDLIGFWNGSYGEVKKELKGRYPKHYWPDDPQTAQPTTRTKKFMTP
ncbi:MAG: ATP-dependent helicase HrpB [Sulfuricurvum sp.]|jgi:ATP-dependent helicase HrpB|uniref:ATP-dependent helicase HrpB n=1 Tax=Sulfuricurvum sp. TaxID=2025608 RepID=UPI0025CD4DEB|nr:ATP-dependent helicase HrpB [Sulfuricurvum sp.]MCK9372649.1 ATP-dependent helicase HrpB [Sulfuricurvum sp.]